MIYIETQLEIDSLSINELVDEGKDRGDQAVGIFFMYRSRIIYEIMQKIGKRLGMLSVERYSCKYGNAKKNEKKNIG